MWWRNSKKSKTILFVLICLGAYVFLAGRRRVTPEDIPDGAIDVRALEQEVAHVKNKEKIQVVKYKDPFPTGLFEKSKDFGPLPGQRNHWEPQTPNDGANSRKNSDVKDESLHFHKVWSMANDAITIGTMWPQSEAEMQQVLDALAKARIVHVEGFDKEDYSAGTAEKWKITLDGGQKAMMKIVWEPETRGKQKLNGLCNYGYELPMAEIAAFHLHRVLGFTNTPYVTGRKVNLMEEIFPVSTPEVQKQLITKGANMCVRGQCYFCDKPILLCPEGGVVEASIAFWMPRPLKLYTFPPKYMPFSTPNMHEWKTSGFNNQTYCKKIRKDHPYELDWYYMDLFDFAVIDSLMYHYDSKHYVIYDQSDARGLTIRLDHGRAFCAHSKDEEFVFMAPLKICCQLRRSTFEALGGLQGGRLSRKLKEYLSRDPLAPILVDEWFTALDRRLDKIINIIEQCSNANGGSEKVLVE